MTSSSQPCVAIVAASLDILGGQGVQAQTLGDALARDGYRVELIPVNPRFPAGARWLRRLPYLRTAANQALYVPSLVRLAGADVVHVFSASFWSFLLGPMPALVVASALNKRVVLHYHSGEAGAHLAEWGALVHPWLKLADQLVVPSDYLAGIFAAHGYRTQVIRNVVDVSRFAYRARHPLRPRLLSTRNLEPYYRVDVVLDAFARVRAHLPEATLTVAGYGSEETRLRRLAGEGVRFVGRVDQESMPRLCDEADIFLNASVVDNQPVSILEAFAAGLPVISTPTGDIAAMVRHNDTGLVVPPLDPAAMASAVLELVANPTTAIDMANRAHQEITRYTWPAVRDQWAAVYADGNGKTRRQPGVRPRGIRSWMFPPAR
jgi:glycosyltransferase involved in cell wall biosynthesis